jgi:large subunit ribosomal protein L6
MSRIARQELPLPSGVTLTVNRRSVEVKGPKGTLQFPLFPEVEVELAENSAQVKRTGAGSTAKASALAGLVRAHLGNMVVGVTEGFAKTLEIVGTGWNAKQNGKGVEMQIGFCHTVKCDPPEGITVAVTTPTELTISGADKQMVGQFAAVIRAVRPPEPYKGKGIRYKGENVRRKAGKSVG